MVDHFFFKQLIQSVHVSKAILTALLTSSVVSCGGGGGKTPALPSKDVKPPYVISTVTPFRIIGSLNLGLPENTI